MRDAEGLAAGVHEIGFEGLLGREGHGVQEQVQLAELRSHLGEDAGDFVVAGDIAGQDQGVGSKSAGEFLDVFLEPLALVGEGEFRARLVPGLRDGPGAGAFVGDPEDDPKFSGE